MSIAIYHPCQPVKTHYEALKYIPPTSPPPTRTTSSSTSMPHHPPPTNLTHIKTDTPFTTDKSYNLLNLTLNGTPPSHASVQKTEARISYNEHIISARISPITLPKYICEEGPSAVIQHSDLEGRIHGVRVCRFNPRISQLLFADHTFILYQATSTKTNCLKEILLCFQAAIIQVSNFCKSSIAYSKNTTPNIVSSILNSLAVTTNVGSGNYLKLPSMVGRSKKAIFNYVNDRIWKNVNHGVKNHFERQVKML